MTLARSRLFLLLVGILLGVGWSPPTGARPIVVYNDAVSLSGLEQLIATGAVRYLIVYQNNCDPEAQRTGIIDPDKVAKHVLELGGDVPTGWGVLDFEMPFDEWIHEGPDSPRQKIAVKSMVETIERMKRLFPKVRWTYYGIPGLTYYLDGATWVTASRTQKDREIARQIAQYGAVMDACDWLGPCAYDTVGKGSLRNPTSIREATRAWHKARTELCVTYVKSKGRDCPVIPFVSPIYQPGGGARFNSVIPSDVMLEDTIRPIMEAGGAGIAIWSPGKRLIDLVTGRISDKNYTEGGGVATTVKNWSGDLGVPEAELRTPDATERLEKMLADAVVEMARQANQAWAGEPEASESRP